MLWRFLIPGNYAVGEYDSEHGSYRVEVNPIGKFLMSKEGRGGSVILSLPPIPMGLIKKVVCHFREHTSRYNSECAVQIFWDRKEKNYYIFYPKQSSGYAFVAFERSVKRECEDILVADIHSHGKIPAFFSSVDDADEKGSRLFGVFGGYGHNEKIIFRVGCGGYFSDVFTAERSVLFE